VLTVHDLLYFPFARDPARPLDPPPAYADLRREAPIAKVRIWNGTEPWLVMTHGHCRTVLTDPRFSVRNEHPNFPEKSAAYGSTMGQDLNIRTLDLPVHKVHQQMMFEDFSRKRVEELRPKVQGVVDGCIDSMLAAGGPVDLVAELAMPVPTLVICELLGVPYEYRDEFTKHALVCTSGRFSASEALAAGKALSDFFDELITMRLAEPSDDLISRLANEQIPTGGLTREQVVGYGRLMLIAGHETSASQIALSVLTLLGVPDQLTELRERGDAAAISNAVEELLRYLSISHSGQRRIALADVQLGDQLIREGDGLIVSVPSANRDETMFPDPDVVDLRRKNARSNLAFGYGIHQCIGQLIARLELRVVFEVLFRRISTLRLAADFSDLIFHHEDDANFGVDQLPVEW
jgi:cytochrome P450